jgi:hypothetical protein
MNRITMIAAGALLGLAAPASAQSTACDRACLRQMQDRFVTAVLAHDPARAPLAIGFRQTQNAIVTMAGAGIWKTIAALGTIQRRYFDPVSGNAELFGTIREGDTIAVASLRLKIEAGQVTEAEWHIAHKGDRGMTGKPDVLFDPDGLEKTPPPERVVAKADRLPREALMRIVNSYFDGIANHNGQTVLAHGGCMRLENGFNISGHPLRPGQENEGFEGKGDCKTGYAGLQIANVGGRRFLVVDEEAQVVVASAVFVRAPGTDKYRNNFMEIFSIDHGRIRSVHAAMFYAPNTIPLPNWPPYDGNFPLAAVSGTAP